MRPDDERYLTRAQLADLLQVSTKSIARWERDGMPFSSWGPRLHRYRLRDVRPWFDAREDAGWR